MPQFMDVHRGMTGITPELLTQAHQADLDIQDNEGMNFKQAWADPTTGVVFCLSEGPSEEALRKVHELSGHPADEVYEVPVEC
jgi:hypothetical protein